MNTKHISQRFVSGLIAVLSVTSLALLLLQSAFPRISGQSLAGLFQSGKTSLLDLYQTFAGGGSFWWADSARECLVATLILTAAFSLFGLRMSRDTK
jgi:hypothetical protein